MSLMLSQNAANPYYFNERVFPRSNKEKGNLGEVGFITAISKISCHILCNITYGHRQKDIDHLLFARDFVIFNECKNVSEKFKMYYSWFLSHVVNRFVEGLPVAQYYARSFGYLSKALIFTLTIPHLNADPLVQKALKGLKIIVIQTGKQLLEEKDINQCRSRIRKQILSVINSYENNTIIYRINSGFSNCVCSSLKLISKNKIKGYLTFDTFIRSLFLRILIFPLRNMEVFF